VDGSNRLKIAKRSHSDIALGLREGKLRQNSDA
jgi:hypothetical protein